MLVNATDFKGSNFKNNVRGTQIRGIVGYT